MDNFGALFSFEAEQNVLGTLLFASDRSWDEVSGILSADDFVKTEHAVIFTAIQRLMERGTAADAVTVMAKLEERGQLQEAGGAAYLGALVAMSCAIANLKHYAEIVRDRAQLRRLLGALKAGEGIIDAPDVPLAEKVGAITEKLESVLTRGVAEHEPVDAKAAAQAWINGIEERFSRGNKLRGLSTGFGALDDYTLGLVPKHLILIAARPSVGKTTLATNIAGHVLHAGGSVFLATMEMSVEDVMNQLCAARTGCSYRALQELDGNDDTIWPAITAYSAQLRDWRLTIDDRGTQTISSIRRGLKRHLRRHGKDTVAVVDYAQLVEHKAENEAVRIGDVSRSMKQIAQELDIPVILISQLNRENVKGGGVPRRPRLSDLKGSGGLEQDASVALLLHDEGAEDPNNPTDYVEVIVAKNRHGKKGVVHLLKQLDRARFVAPAPADYEDWKQRQAGDTPTAQRPARRPL
ncbi:MAG: DnaB-like helicase C-terminal domain-containing protein [Moraxellaceae bacterium]